MSISLKCKTFTLVLGDDASVISMKLTDSERELLELREKRAFCTVTQDRPFNNEVKLSHPNKRTTYYANRMAYENGMLRVGFDIAPYEALIEVKEADSYIAFTLKDFIVHPDDYPGLVMSPPPVAEFRLIRLPLIDRGGFGEWLNVMNGGGISAAVIASSLTERVDSELCDGYRIYTADAVRGIKLKGSCAAIIADRTENFLDAMAEFERDYNLPSGADSRRGELINASAYWCSNVNPSNVDEHIRYAKKGGFRLMLLYYTCMFKEEHGYGLCGDYDYNAEFPNGRRDLEEMVAKIRAAGIVPGLHFLQTHIGLWSRYVTPHADHRINLTRRFTLSEALTADDTEVFVEENPDGSVLADRARILNFGGELISYTSYTTEYPYRFTGCTRGVYDTEIIAHRMGEIGGILDVSEFGGWSAYVNEDTDLQDEVAEKIADAYNTGFGFVYFDGSEGTNPPFEYNVPRAQYRVYKKLSPAPLYCEGAAKAHFGWHFQSGGNAFDIFCPSQFKPMIDRHPLEEAPRMRQDFTRLNFGWWGYWTPGAFSDAENAMGTQADMFEYGTSRAAAWDCPITIQLNLGALNAHPRTDDILEVMRRWEDVRAKKWLTEEQKELLRVPGAEYTLIINEKGEYELLPCEMLDIPSETGARGFVFEHEGKRCAAFWNVSGEGEMNIAAGGFTLVRDFGGEEIPYTESDGAACIPTGARAYMITDMSLEEVKKAFAEAYTK